MGVLPHARRGTQSEGRASHGHRAGEFEQRSRITLHEYAREWIERYQGTGRRGFREETRAEYRALLDKYALSHFSSRTKLTDITPRHIATFVGWLCEQTKPAATKDDPLRAEYLIALWLLICVVVAIDRRTTEAGRVGLVLDGAIALPSATLIDLGFKRGRKRAGYRGDYYTLSA
jgi:hypothetical protein